MRNKSDLEKEDIKEEIENIKKKAIEEDIQENLEDENEKEDDSPEEIELDNVEEENIDEEPEDSKDKTKQKKEKKNKNNKKSKKDEDKKVPGETIDKVLNCIIILLIICVISIIGYFAYQMLHTKQSSIPKIEQALKEFQEKENYSYIVSIKDENDDDTSKIKNIKISKVNGFIEYQFMNFEEDTYCVIKQNDKNTLYLVKNAEVTTLKDTESEEYKKYSEQISKDYLNIKKYSLGSLIAIQNSENIILSKNGGLKLQFNNKTHMPSVFIIDGKKYSFEFSNEEAKLIMPYLEAQIKAESEKQEVEDNK